VIWFELRRPDLRLLIFRKGSCSEPLAWGREETVQKESYAVTDSTS